jgi:hypothetical protein
MQLVAMVGKIDELFPAKNFSKPEKSRPSIVIDVVGRKVIYHGVPVVFLWLVGGGKQKEDRIRKTISVSFWVSPIKSRPIQI